MKINHLALTKNILIYLMMVVSIHIQAQGPNIILIISDDLGVDATNGYHANALMPTTPTLDSLMNNGIAFDNAWAYPVCTPTRSTMMSGKYGIKTGVRGVPGNLDTIHTSVFKELKKVNYAGAVIGKWHMSQPSNVNHPTEHGVDYYMGFIDGFPSDYSSWAKTQNGVTTTENAYVSSTITDTAIAWIDQQTKPWFLWLAHAAPHSPYHVPPSNLHTQTNTTGNLRKYFAMIEAMDTEIGRLLNSMTQVERDNTLIIYIADNGSPNNILRDYPTGHGKGSLYQGGIRVPMIVAGAGVTRKGVREAAMVSVTDIFATILEVAGAELEGGKYNSLSFKHLLDNSAGNTRTYNYMDLKSGANDGWAIRNKEYKLIEFPIGTQEFYNLIEDSLEFNNLLTGTLNSLQMAVKADLEKEAAAIRNGWSCQDYIKNGDEDSIDCGGSLCSPCATTGIQVIDSKSQISVYPNPAQGNITIESSDGVIQEVQVFDLIGKQVLDILKPEKRNLKIDLSVLRPNEYILKISTQNSISYQRITKK